MDIHQDELLSKVKQGHIEAISSLINSKLKPKKIAAILSTKKDLLHITIKSSQKLPEKPLVEFIQKVLASVEESEWNLVKICSIQEGEDFPDWLAQLSLDEVRQDSIEKKARSGDLSAIKKILDVSLANFLITTKVKLVNGQIQILLTGNETPIEKVVIPSIQSELLRLEIPSVTSAKVYGKCLDEDFPEWDYIISLDVKRDKESSSCKDKEAFSETTIKSPVENKETNIDPNWLTNNLFSLLEKICFSPVQARINEEENYTLQEAVNAFTTDLENDLKREIAKVPDKVLTFLRSNKMIVAEEAVIETLEKVERNSFSNLILSIRQLQRATDDLLNLDLPENVNLLSSLFSGTAYGLTDGLVGNDGFGAKEIAIGATVGHLIMPGLGGVIGSAIGSWIGNSRQQKEIESCFEYYQQNRERFLSNLQDFAGHLYDEIVQVVEESYDIKLASYSSIAKAIDLYDQGNVIYGQEEYTEEDISKALELYKEAIEVYPAFALAWNNMGYMLTLCKKYDEAESAFDRALKLDGSLAAAYANKGDLYESTSNYQSAIENYDLYLKLEPKDYDVISRKNNCLILAKEYEKAISVSDFLISLDSEHPLGWYNKAQSLIQIDQTERGLESLKVAISLNTVGIQDLILQSDNFDSIQENDDFIKLMESSIGVEYSNMKALLSQRRWQEADQELAKIMKDIVKKISDDDSICCSAIHDFPERDLLTIDKAWLGYSNGKFGFSVQKKFFEKSNRDRNIFGESIGWRTEISEGSYRWVDNLSFNYDFDLAPIGHLPSGFWAGDDGWFENRRDRLIAIFNRLDKIKNGDKKS